VEKLTKDRG